MIVQDSVGAMWVGRWNESSLRHLVVISSIAELARQAVVS